MFPRVAYRHTHEQTNVAAVVRVLKAEFGLEPLDTEMRGQELTLHGLLHCQRYEEHRGLLLRGAMKHLADAGVVSWVLHDAARTARLRERLTAADPEYRHQLLEDLGSPPSRPLSLETDFAGEARVLLVEARHSTRGLPLHVLLARREDGLFYIMNTDTGEEHAYSADRLAMHLATPVSFGAMGFAGRQYLYTGVAVKVAAPVS